MVGDSYQFRVVLGRAYRGLTGGFLLHRNFSVAISVSPHVCFILVLMLISMYLRYAFMSKESSTQTKQLSF